MPAEPRRYQWHTYLAHASEDKPFVRALAVALREQGWSTWLDEGELIVGRSLLAQLDAGLASSRFGVVVLSPSFFAKRWPKRELDALFSLEDDDETRVLPVWLKVNEHEVRSFSAILSGRLAVVTDGNDVDAVATDLTRSMRRILLDEGYRSEILRQETQSSLAWVNPPAFYDESLRFFDELVLGPDTSHLPDPVAVSIGETLERAPAFDGKVVATVGYQVSSQLLLTHTDHDVVEYVLQVKSGDPELDHLICYVRCWGDDPDTVPSPPPDHLLMFIGVLIAVGAVHSTRGTVLQAGYFCALAYWYVPRATVEASPNV
jgi:hypothetical protein